MSPLSAALLSPGQPVIVDGRLQGRFEKLLRPDARLVLVVVPGSSTKWSGDPSRISACDVQPIATKPS